MPELPEVETVRRGLQPAMEGARFVRVEARRKDLRRPFPKDFVARLEGQTVTGLGRRAKYLTADLSSGEVLLMHLGMSGSFRITMPPSLEGRLQPPSQDDGAVAAFHHPRSQDRAHDHVVFTMSSGARIVFNDPRRFGLMLLVPRAELDNHSLMKEVGPEPLGNAFEAGLLARACQGSRRDLKAALMDQTTVAGLGNIYVCEALHRAHLSPKRIAASIASKSGAPTERAVRLVAAIQAVLIDAIQAGGSSLRDHRRPDGELGYFQHHFRVYDREGEPCVSAGCKGKVKRITQGGRSTFFCPSCQK